MSIENWNQTLDIALTRTGNEISGLAGDIVTFFEKLSLVERSLLAGLGLLLLFYLILPGGKGEGAGNPSGKYFAGILLVFVAAGTLGGLMMAGRISL